MGRLRNVGRGFDVVQPIAPECDCIGASGWCHPTLALSLHRDPHEVGPVSVYFSYPLLPWIGVMLVGYGAAGLFELPAKFRDQRLLRIGMGLVSAWPGSI